MTQLTPEQMAEIVARDSRFDHDAVPLWHHKVYEDRRALLSHIDALSLAERHAVREYAKWFEQCVQHEERIAALTAEIAALRRDAERLGWIERHWFMAASDKRDSIEFCFNEMWETPGKNLRAAIDSAMSPKVLPEREG